MKAMKAEKKMAMGKKASDKMGRALKKKTADAEGRAMMLKKGGMAKKKKG